jgi:hypothetical protein
MYRAFFLPKRRFKFGKLIKYILLIMLILNVLYGMDDQHF